MKILFITRKYPPQIGGMEKYSYNLIKYWPSEKRVILLNKQQWHLIWWLPYAFLMTILLVLQCSRARDQKKFDAIYLCDSLLAPLGIMLKKVTKIAAAVTCHGLDVTYPYWWYQKIVIPALKKMNKIICVSRATMDECVKRGIPNDKLVFIPNGVEIKPKLTTKLSSRACRGIPSPMRFLTSFGMTHDIDLQNKQILLTVGRLVKRKGIAWFCENVMPKLPENIVYLIVGGGPEKKKIANLIEKHNLKNQVFLLGKLSNQDLEKVYAISDIFVMPNIKVKGDMEGFGLVALEAANYGLSVVASNLEGISDAIKSGENGILVPPQNTEEFIRQINILLKDPEKKQALVMRALKYNQENFNWQKIVQRYYQTLKVLLL